LAIHKELLIVTITEVKTPCCKNLSISRKERVKETLNHGEDRREEEGFRLSYPIS